MILKKSDLVHSPTLTLSDTDAERLAKRQAVLIPLAQRLRISKHETELAALQLGISERSVRNLVKRYRDTNEDPLPGTTKSNIRQRGDYDSEGKACMTLPEFETWLLKAICGYHARRHARLGISPMEKLLEGLEKGEFPRVTVDPRTYLIDFLPGVRRRLQRDGFRIHRIAYYDPKLDELIARRHEYPDGFDIRYDPRNLRFVWVELPKDGGYLEVPYRHKTNPDVSLWQWQQALKRVKRENAPRCDEDMVFDMVTSRQEDIARSQAETRRARRNRERATQSRKYVGSALPADERHQAERREREVKPFNVIDVSWTSKR
jgi:putative transposase